MTPYKRKFNENVGELPTSENCMIRFVEIEGDRIIENPSYDSNEELVMRNGWLPKSWTVETLGDLIIDNLYGQDLIGYDREGELEINDSISVGVIPNDGGTMVNVYRYVRTNDGMQLTNKRPMKGN